MILINLLPEETWRVYRITNRNTGKVYIGQTVKPDVQTRLAEHFSHARAGLDSCPKLHRSILKHGEEAFEIKALAFCLTRKEADEREVAEIAACNSVALGYNVSSGGSGHLRTECKRGHLLAGNRDARSRCKTCVNDNRKAWQANNSDKIKRYGRAFYQEHQADMRARMNAKYWSDPESARLQKREMRAQDPQANQTYQKQRRDNDLEASRAKERAYYARDKEKQRRQARERWARLQTDRPEEYERRLAANRGRSKKYAT